VELLGRVTGWVEIARVLGVSVRTAKRWRNRLPVYRLDGARKIRARTADLQEWKERNTRRQKG
jgi:excisionase family DNA binding protein